MGSLFLLDQIPNLMSNYPHIFRYLRPDLADWQGQKIVQAASRQLGLKTGEIRLAQLFSLAEEAQEEQLLAFAEACIQDPLTDQIEINQLNWPAGFASAVAIAQLPGVTDDEGRSAQMAWADFFNLPFEPEEQRIFSQTIYLIEKDLTAEELKALTQRLLGNPLIHHFSYFKAQEGGFDRPFYVPKVQIQANKERQLIDLAPLSDEELLRLSKEMVLALNLAEMQAIRDYYGSEAVQTFRATKGLPAQPTDCELEVLAQTWSEHCKHKEFNALIHYKNLETGEEQEIHSLFKTFIKGATDNVAASLAKKGNDWLVKVFSDNAGVVKATDKHLFVWKVETHNSPSALDPYGGAITGILGNNRDPLGTGVGGAQLLFNTNVLCFGPPNYNKALLKGQLHPRQIMEGVVSGIEDGGNKSGVPTVNGSIVFDERYSGKPLVYCGTAGIMPYDYLGKNSWEKPIDANDRIIMAGGRVGKDGIHGATFSSIEIDEHSPMSAVQIGSPITQKMLYDFMRVATAQGLIKCSTDNGAGGLSSSVGELAEISGGALVQLEKVPLKYAGLRPWEIFVSESQERMTLVVETEKWPALEKLAQQYEVELSDIGYFTNDGYLDIRYEEEQIALLSMQFLHEGVPQKEMWAEWEKPELQEPALPETLDYNQLLLDLMSSLNICSRESIIRQYDHEVKGKTILKPLMGAKGKAPQDAAVLRFDFSDYQGVAVSNGIIPRYGDIDAYQMSASAFDEAIRQIISVGGRLPNMTENDDIFWSINDNFCVPDSEFHPEHNPDGKLKLAKLVQMCQALYDMASFFDIPLTSGKDSMKNDFKAEGQKISVPPTILYSFTAKMKDVRQSISAEFKMPGDLIYQLGTTYNELGASEFYQLFGELGANVPKVRKETAKALYLKVMQANEAGLIASSHDLSDGGLAVALAESCFGGDLGANIQLEQLGDLTAWQLLFSESNSRFLVSIAPENQAAFEEIMGDAAFFLGQVSEDQQLTIQYGQEELIQLSNEQLETAWSQTLSL